MEDAIPYFKVIVENIAYLVGMILIGVVTVLLQKGRKYLAKRWEIELSDQQFQAINRLAWQGIAYAEERARKWAGEGTEDRPSGAQKLDWALQFVMEHVQDLKLDEMARDKLVALIEANLQVKRTHESLPAKG